MIHVTETTTGRKDDEKHGGRTPSKNVRRNKVEVRIINKKDGSIHKLNGGYNLNNG